LEGGKEERKRSGNVRAELTDEVGGAKGQPFS